MRNSRPPMKRYKLPDLMLWLMVRGKAKGQMTLAMRAARDSTEEMMPNRLPVSTPHGHCGCG